MLTQIEKDFYKARGRALTVEGVLCATASRDDLHIAIGYLDYLCTAMHTATEPDRGRQ